MRTISLCGHDKIIRRIVRVCGRVPVRLAAVARGRLLGYGTRILARGSALTSFSGMGRLQLSMGIRGVPGIGAAHAAPD